MAQEGAGMGTWSRGMDAIPVIEPGELLAALDITAPTHPRLRAAESNANLTTRKDEAAEEEVILTSTEYEDEKLKETISETERRLRTSRIVDEDA